jgi:hypothetical protein
VTVWSHVKAHVHRLWETQAVRVVLATACLVAAGVAVVALIAGNPSSEEEPVELPPPRETIDPLPPLPRGWTTTTNAVGGFALGVPPGWSVKPSGDQTTMRSPTSSVVVRVTADRTDAALNVALDDYVETLLSELGGEGQADAPLTAEQAGYEQASAVGTDDEGRRLEVIVVRRPELAAFPVLVASDDAVKAAQLDPVVARLVGSLRGRPAISS